ncbi:predicted protein [Aspergillus nidulans FGSC A4]|uniref:MARVEL domain-containing protein n=1 Tax=Emericella nidulans (strain FGSC A4 / ATCC 38163 / CBS 112.46 / NRRL 194 / M139) TaxID=227321 RepID=Q5AZM1_EMENI|nr:hypothetical protein [Aspergillus nidulans FGSC A4]EAA58643.1 predicted protein [Aspergillus nidulans FGSC A4]CBF69836.1 TPA: conserved hypothetical protein [Aspergillus nidulans FGSC A4]|eukprot:XP_663863.1 predicted protein [Aspergillus nidulans FGSC A4]
MPPSNATQNSQPGKLASPVKHYHERRSSFAVGIWILSILVLGLAAAVVAKAPASPLRSSASYNVAVASLQFFLFFLAGSKPVSTTDARPPKAGTITLVISTLIWAAAFPIMFIFASEDDRYAVVDFDKRVLALDIGTGVVSGLENITLACGAFGASIFLCIIFQWYYTAQLYRGHFTRDHIEAAYND